MKPRKLAGRAFAVVAHGDSQGHEDLRRSLTQWLTDIGMIQAGVENAARSLVALVHAIRSAAYRAPDAGLRHPRQK